VEEAVAEVVTVETRTRTAVSTIFFLKWCDAQTLQAVVVAVAVAEAEVCGVLSAKSSLISGLLGGGGGGGGLISGNLISGLLPKPTPKPPTPRDAVVLV
jgi:hypothetical protein